MADKVYVYEYDFEFITAQGNLKKEHRINLFYDIKELIEGVDCNKYKWYYISNEKVSVFSDRKEISIEKVLNPFG